MTLQGEAYAAQCFYVLSVSFKELPAHSAVEEMTRDSLEQGAVGAMDGCRGCYGGVMGAMGAMCAMGAMACARPAALRAFVLQKRLGLSFAFVGSITREFSGNEA